MITNAPIEHSAFVRRLTMACDTNSQIPRLNHGRNKEIAVRMGSLGDDVTEETVRKWFAGMTSPRRARMALLARVLGVDENWLATGAGAQGDRPVSRFDMPTNLAKDPAPPMATRVLPPSPAAKHLAIGLVGISGAHITQIFERGPVHFKALIKGAEYAFHAIVGIPFGREHWFSVPDGTSDTLILGVIPLGPAWFRMIELDRDGVDAVGERKGDEVRFAVDSDLRTGERAWREIVTFAQRP